VTAGIVSSGLAIAQFEEFPMTSIGHTIPTRMRQLATVCLLAVGVTLVHAPFASAAPGEWDIEAYDACMAKTVRDPATCCLISGGNIGPEPDICVAPAAVEQGDTQQPSETTTFVPMPRGPVNMPGLAAG
jgi:hypothetical protein